MEQILLLKLTVLNKQFSSVFSIEDVSGYETLPFKNVSDKMTKISFSVDDVLKRLTNLKINKSCGPDQIHPRILYEARNEIALPLKLIYECSFETKQLPDDWKSANISAIYKKGCKSDAVNYRPISLTCVVCKILESMLRDHVHNGTFQEQ